MFGSLGFGLSLPALVPMLIMTAIAFWWRMSAIQWYEEMCREENNGELPKTA